jgi:hypothetical protein
MSVPCESHRCVEPGSLVIEETPILKAAFCSRALTNCGVENAVSELRTVPTQQSKYLLCCVQRRASAQNPKQAHVGFAEWAFMERPLRSTPALACGSEPRLTSFACERPIWD